MRHLFLSLLVLGLVVPSPAPAETKKVATTRPNRVYEIQWLFLSVGVTINLDYGKGERGYVYLAVISFDQDPEIEDVLSVLKDRGYRPAGAIALARTIPLLKSDFKGKVVALGSHQYVDGSVHHPYVDFSSERDIKLTPLMIDRSWHFLAVKNGDPPSAPKLSSVKR